MPKRSVLSTTALTLSLAAVLGTLTGCGDKPDPEAQVGALKVVSDEPDAVAVNTAWDTSERPENTAEQLACTPVLFVTLRGTAEPLGKDNLLTQVSRELTKQLTQRNQKKSEQSGTRQGGGADEAENDAPAAEAEAPLTRHDIDYPATTDFGSGVPEGMRKMIDTLNLQVKECPEQRFVLGGYSQGALVVGEALTDPAQRFFGAGVGELSSEAAQRLSGVVFYGDPRFLSSDSFNQGTYKQGVDGALPRVTGALDGYAELIRNFCVGGDIVCQASQQLNETGHVAYYSNGMTRDGAAFLLQRLDAAATP